MHRMVGLVGRSWAPEPTKNRPDNKEGLLPRGAGLLLVVVVGLNPGAAPPHKEENE